MVLTLLIVAGMLIVAPIIGAIIGIIVGLGNSGKPRGSSNFHKDSVESPWLYFGDESDTPRRSNQRRNTTRMTIIGKAASTGRMRTMTGMTTVMTASGMRGSSDALFRYSIIQLFKIMYGNMFAYFLSVDYLCML